MNRITVFLALVLVAIVAHLYYVFFPIEGVDVSDLAVSMQSPAERYEYHRNLKLLLSERDLGALEYLINANCGGGAGCYDHGKTLVQVLVKLGDSSFSEIIPKLRKEEAGLLFNLLAAGFEYGEFMDFMKWKGFSDRFPLTFGVLNERLQ